MAIHHFLRAILPGMAVDEAAPRGLNGTSRNLHHAVVCRTTDEVSLDVARTSCDRHGLAFLIADREDGLPADGVAGMVFDLNDLAFSLAERVRLLKLLVQATFPYPVAVASYDLESEMKDRLEACGMLVYRRIEPALFNDLAKRIKTADRRSPRFRFSAAGDGLSGR
jgi:hypothetical protein